MMSPNSHPCPDATPALFHSRNSELDAKRRLHFINYQNRVVPLMNTTFPRISSHLLLSLSANIKAKPLLQTDGDDDDIEPAVRGERALATEPRDVSAHDDSVEHPRQKRVCLSRGASSGLVGSILPDPLDVGAVTLCADHSLLSSILSNAPLRNILPGPEELSDHFRADASWTMSLRETPSTTRLKPTTCDASWRTT